MVIELIQGAALLLALCWLQSLVVRLCKDHQTLQQLTSGALFGIICVIGMMTPITLTPGLIFDARNVVLGLSGLFGGPVVALIAGGIAGAYRLWLGGIGVTVGIATLITSVLLGLGYRYCQQQGWLRVGLVQLILFGGIVNATTIVIGITLIPAPAAHAMLSNIALPYIITGILSAPFLGLFLQDIRGRLKTEQALSQSKSYLRSIVNAIPDVLFVLDEDGRYLEVLSPTSDLLFKEASKLIGHRVHDLLPSDVADRALRSIQDAIQHKTTQTVEYEIQTIGGEKHFEGRILPRDFQQGEKQTVVFLARDISERKKLQQRERQLLNIQRALSELNDAILRLEEESALFPLACQIAVKHGGVVLAWVGVKQNAHACLTPTTWHGKGKNDLNNVLFSCASDTPEGQCPVGIAFRKNRSVINNDFRSDPLIAAWCNKTIPRDMRSGAAFPIHRSGQPYAVFNLLSNQTDAFDEETVALLAQMAKNISFALDNFDRENLRLQGEIALRKSESRFRQIVQEMPVPMQIHNERGEILLVNQAWINWTGYTLDDIPTIAEWTQKALGSESSMGQENIRKLFTTQRRVSDEYTIRCKDGSERHCFFESSQLGTFADGSQVVISMAIDITERKQAEQIIWQQANFDSLTSLPNRRMFVDRLEHEIRQSHRTSLPFALLFVDLDHFKDVNDALGHTMGDELLTSVSQRLKKCVRDADTIARLGGDEFTIIISNLHEKSSVARICDAILQSFSVPFHLKGEAVYISVSIGITLYPEDGSTIENLLINADQAMYAAKKQGRNRYQYFTPTMQIAAQNRRQLVKHLRQAFDGDQFLISYQPIIELATEKVHKAEALVRWQHPERGIISPADFIPIAEEIGMIHELGNWVFQVAANQAAIWRKTRHPEFQVAINMAPIQFRKDNKNGASWFDYLKKLGTDGTSVIIEITEGVLMDASNHVIDRLLAFRDAGIQVAIDDFGTGYSSLAYLKKFDIDYIKIDRTFVTGLAPGSKDLVLCEAIIVMAHKLDIKVIAEGVETTEQRDLLLHAGCDYAQGFLFSKPLSPEVFDQVFNEA